MFIFRGTHVKEQLLLYLWRFIHHPPDHAKLSRITPSQPCKPAGSIAETLVRTGCCWLCFFFFQGLLGHYLRNSGWLRPLLRKTFAKLSRKNSICKPQPLGMAQTKGKHQGPWCLALAKPRFWKLGCWIWALFLETLETDTSVNQLSKLFMERCQTWSHPYKELQLLCYASV